MNLDVYNKFVEVTEELGYSSAPNLIFQSFIEERLNELEYSKFLDQNKTDKAAREFYIRLKSPNNKNTKERGLKICLFNNNIFREKHVEAGTTIFKFNPMLKVIGFSNDSCCECGKYLVEFGEKQDEQPKSSDELTQNMELMQIKDVIKCNNCNMRAFCGEACKIKAKLSWHNLECDFINYLKKELVFINDSNLKSNNDSNKFENIKNQQDQELERVILLVVTTFRLLVCLINDNEEITNIVLNMSDHLNLYKDFIEKGTAETLEQEILFNEVKNTFLPLIKNYFAMKKQGLLKSQKSYSEIKEINENGILRAFFLILVNVSAFMDYFNDNLGLLFDPIFSMFNHSCDPNCALVWRDEDAILVKTTERLKASNELTLNYVPIYMPKEMRQKQLKNSFFFDCDCYKCSVLDKEFDSMLPVNCYYCGQNNKGFLLENFEKYNSSPKIDSKIICCNCENLIEADKVFEKYLKIFQFFKELNRDIEKIEDLCNWKIGSLHNQIFTDYEFNKSTLILKECFEFVPLKSWPMSMLISLVKTGVQQREPFTLNVLRLTYLSNFFIENMFERKENFKTLIGASLYDLAVSSADYLFDQYLIFKESIDSETISIVGWGAFSLCILAYKQLEIQFLDNSEKKNIVRIERAQKDMIQLSKEIQRLLEHCYKNKDCSNCKKFNQHKFETNIYEFEKYMQCSQNVQLQPLLVYLEDSDYETFNVQKQNNESKEAEETEKVVAKKILDENENENENENETAFVEYAPAPFFKLPKWIFQL